MPLYHSREHLRALRPRARTRLIKRRTVLITGATRSGTTYTAKLFHKAGFDLRHEEVGELGSVSGLFVVDAPDYTVVPAKWGLPIRHASGRRGDFSFDHVFHQTRHPLKVIASQAKNYNRESKSWYHRVGIAPRTTKPNLIHATLVYLRMTTLADEQAEYRYKVEDMEEVWPLLLAELDLPYVQMPELRTDVNKGHGFSKPVPITIADIEKHSLSLARMVRDKALCYGYDLEDQQ